MGLQGLKSLWPFDRKIAFFSKPCCSNFERYLILEHNILNFPTGMLWVLKIIQYIYRMVLSFEFWTRVSSRPDVSWDSFVVVLLDRTCYIRKNPSHRHTHTKFIPRMPRGLAANHVKRWLSKAKGLFCSSVIKWSVNSQMLGRRSCVGWHQLGEIEGLKSGPNPLLLCFDLHLEIFHLFGPEDRKCWLIFDSFLFVVNHQANHHILV